VPDLSSPSYRDVLGRFATGVVVVTTVDGEGPIGVTCQSFVALSLDPPLVSFAMTSTGASWTRMKGSSHFAISVLAADQAELATQFATSGIDKFAGVAMSHSALDDPLIDGALAHVEVEVVDVATYGDHDLVVARVVNLGAFEGEPVLFFRGSFRHLQ